MDVTLFSTFVGLICNFRQEKGAREALDHQKFIEWLEYHRHEDLKNLIVNQAALLTEVDNLLRAEMTQMLHKMDELSKILISIAGRLDEFKGLAAAVSSAQSELSDQALVILVAFAKSEAENLYYADYGMGKWTLECWGGGDHMSGTVTEPRFIKDDLTQLINWGFLDLEINSQGYWFCHLTRSGSRFVKAVGDKVKLPEAPLPE